MSKRAIAHLRRADPAIAAVIDLVGPCRFAANAAGTHLDAVIRAIVYQQLSGSAASTIHGRLMALFGGAPTAVTVLAASEDSLRSVGLSRQKVAYLKDLARLAHSGELPIESLHDLDDAAILAALTRVKGVGVWTAQMFLMFRLGRPDVLPVLDLGIRKAVQRAYRLRELPSPERVRKLGAAWSPHGTIASWYLWRSLDAVGASRTPPEKRQGAASTPPGRGGRHGRRQKPGASRTVKA